MKGLLKGEGLKGKLMCQFIDIDTTLQTIKSNTIKLPSEVKIITIPSKYSSNLVGAEVIGHPIVYLGIDPSFRLSGILFDDSVTPYLLSD